jgi:hypothetical protein
VQRKGLVWAQDKLADAAPDLHAGCSCC